MRKHVLVYAADSRWAAMAERLEELMADGGFRVLKDEAHTCAGLVRGPGGAWVPLFVILAGQVHFIQA